MVITPYARSLNTYLNVIGHQVPAVIITGPRQAGKTTLCRLTWPDKTYVNLERPDMRAFASADPLGFLRSYPEGAILDEVQRVPDLTSWLQVLIDADQTPNRWVLTGSEMLTLTERTSQSLAGRALSATLLPFDVGELQAANALRRSESGPAWSAAVLRGGYPAPLSQPVELTTWLSGYVQSYLERDVRSLLGVGDLARYQDFLALAAAWSAQIINLSRIGGDVGVTHPTARSWLSVLEATFVVHRLRPWHRNLGKRLSRRPKLYFWDSGLLCWLLRLTQPQQLVQHPLRGPIFETWVISELLKCVYHAGERADAWFYRDQSGLEVDLLLRRSDHWLAVEVKSASTLATDFFKSLRRFEALVDGTLEGLPLRRVLIYGGGQRQRRHGIDVVPWTGIADLVHPGRPGG